MQRAVRIASKKALHVKYRAPLYSLEFLEFENIVDLFNQVFYIGHLKVRHMRDANVSPFRSP
jgi:hypothetical protein